MTVLLKLVDTLLTALAVLGCFWWGKDLLSDDPARVAKYFGVLCILNMALSIILNWMERTFPRVKQIK